MQVREVKTSNITRNLVKSFNPFLPKVDFQGPHYPFAFNEFPFYQSLSALISKLFRYDAIASCRIMSIISLLISLLGIFAILKSDKINDTSLYLSLTYFLSTPLMLIQSTAAQPDMLMFSTYIWSFWFLKRAVNYSSLKEWIYLCFFLLFAVMSKITILILLFFPVITVLVLSSFSKKQMFIKSILLFIFFILPVAGWITHGQVVNRLYQLYLFDEFTLKGWFKPHLFINVQNFNYYKSLYMQLKYCYLTYYPPLIYTQLLLFILAAKSVIKKSHFLHGSYLLSLALYFSFFIFHTSTHYYYLIPIQFWLVYYLAHYFNNVRYKLSYVFFAVMIVLCVSINLNFSKREMKRYPNQSDYEYIIKKINNKIPENKIVVVSSFPTREILYHLKNIGWDLNINVNEFNFYHKSFSGKIPKMSKRIIKQLKTFIKQGANYYIVTDLYHFSKIPDYVDFLLNNFKIEVYEPNEFIIFKIDT